jgi:hypothetical protein
MASNGGDASELAATANANGTNASSSSTARGEAAGEGAGEGADGAAASAEDCSVTGAGTKKQAAKGKGGKGGKSPNKSGGESDDGEPCSNCGTVGATRRCSQCRQTQYCGEACFRQHWKHGGHKKACAAYVLAAAAQAQQDRLCKRAAEAEQCLVCLEPPREPTALPCGHSFCTACVVELRAKGVSDACPLCRAPLPPGPEKLSELGYRVWAKISRAVDPNHTSSWPPLSTSQQREMDGAIVMLQEAVDQVSGGTC